MTNTAGWGLILIFFLMFLLFDAFYYIFFNDLALFILACIHLVDRMAEYHQPEYCVA